VAIKASPGARPSELAKEMGVRPTQVSVLIAKARADKLVVKKGEGYALKGKP
jgi:Mn-dependent DtxR family transcriptional regulator